MKTLRAKTDVRFPFSFATFSIALAILFSFTRASANTLAPQPFKIMPLGDSITYGFNTTNSDGYRAPLYRSLTQRGFKINFVGSQVAGDFPQPNNEGHPGYRIDQISALIDQTLAANQPDLVLLMLGTNDLIQQYDIAGAPARFDALITQIQKDLPKARILVASIPTIADNTSFNCGAKNCDSAVVAYNSAIASSVTARVAKGEAIGFVDIYSALPVTDIETDHVHPDDAGGVVMANSWLSAITSIYTP